MIRSGDGKSPAQSDGAPFWLAGNVTANETLAQVCFGVFCVNKKYLEKD